MKYDLIELNPYAEIFEETKEIFFYRGADRTNLIEGWTDDEEMSWSNRKKSTLHVHFMNKDTKDMSLRIKPLHYPESPGQTLQVFLNGESLEKLKLKKGWRTYRVRLPGSRLNAGLNEIQFEYGYLKAPRDVYPNSTDPRTLGVGFREIRFDGKEPQIGDKGVPEKSSAEQDFPLEYKNENIVIKRPLQIDYYLELPEKCELRLSGFTKGNAEVTVTAETDEQPGRVLGKYVFDELKEPQELNVRIPEIYSGIARLSFIFSVNSLGNGLEFYDAGLYAEVKRGALVSSAGGFSRGQKKENESRRSGNVIIYVIDALRADALGAYGNPEGLTPEMDALAQSSALFAKARSQSSWTRSSVATILTGLYPSEHGALKRTDGIRKGIKSIADYLNEADYTTIGLTTNGNIEGKSFRRGFDHFLHLAENLNNPAVHRTGIELNETIFEIIDSCSDRPFFIYAHATDPHSPYVPPRKYKERFFGMKNSQLNGSSAALRRLLRDRINITNEQIDAVYNLYKAEVAFVDRAVGDFIRGLKTRNLWNDMLFILTADHGEEFFEHGNLEHGRSLYEEQLHIPLIIKIAHSANSKLVSAPVMHLDILPTALSQLQLNQMARKLPGIDMMLLPDSIIRNPSRNLYAELNLDRLQLETFYFKNWKFILNELKYDYWGDIVPSGALLNVKEDPEEKFDLAAEKKILAGWFRFLIRKKKMILLKRGDERGPRVTEDKGEELLEVLRALGYVS